VRPPTKTPRREPPLLLARKPVERALERSASWPSRANDIDDDKIQRFGTLLSERLDEGDANARRGYIASVISRIEVGDGIVRLPARRIRWPNSSSVATKKLAVLYADGAPERIRTSGLCLRRVKHHAPGVYDRARPSPPELDISTC